MMAGSGETWLVTGAAGFIGSNFVHLALREDWCARVVAYDALTYAGNMENLEEWLARPDRCIFVRGDVADPEALTAVLAEHAPARVIHFAAESHVDRSIEDPAPFLRTNVTGTQVLLDAARAAASRPRVLHVSTDEVYGSLELDSAERFHEGRAYDPRSPYAASKAASDFLARAAFHTHGQDVVITNCSNNYGPYQFPEKLIPLAITNLLRGEQVPVYGDGLNVRDWIHVEDHCRAVRLCLEQGRSGETYCIGADNEQANIELIRGLLRLLGADDSAVRFVRDRPGHDRRYAIDSTKVRRELGWSPRIGWEEGLRATVDWYRGHPGWVERVRTGEFLKFRERHYGGG